MLLHAVAGWAFYFLRECADLTYRVEASLDLENWSHVVTDAGLVGGKVAVPEVGSRSFLRLRMY